MSIYVRTCPSGNKFNTGGSYCPIDPGKVKAVVLASVDLPIPYNSTAEEIKKMCHADRPERIYPIKNIVEYAPSGGEAQTETKGYGGTKIIGYSAKVDALTIGDYDIEVVKNITRIKNTKMYVFYIDSENQVHGVSKSEDKENIYGFPAIVYCTDQSFDTSSAEANTVLNIALEDSEKFMLSRTAFTPSFDIYDSLMGLMNVSFVPTDESKYVLVDSSNTNISSVYKSITTECFSGNPTAVSYNSDDQSFTITGATPPKLLSPSVLLEKNIAGIEQSE